MNWCFQILAPRSCLPRYQWRFSSSACRRSSPTTGGLQRLRLVIVVNVIGAFTGLFWLVALFMAVSMRTRDPDPTLPAAGYLGL